MVAWQEAAGAWTDFRCSMPRLCGYREKIMPARSKAQQRAAGAALAVKRGEADRSSLQGASKEMFATMTEKDLVEFASTSRGNLPDKVDEDD